MKKRLSVYRKPRIRSKKIKLNLFFTDSTQFSNLPFMEQNQGQLLACCSTCFSCSDRTFKKVIRPLKNVLPKIEKIQAVSFQWKKSDRIPGLAVKRQQIGVIAQEVEDVFPELVATFGKGYKAVDYAKLSAVLIEAVKELREENISMKRRIDKLEGSQ